MNDDRPHPDDSQEYDQEECQGDGFTTVPSPSQAIGGGPRHTRELAKAKLAAQRAVQRVEKDGTNPHHKYAYATSEAIVTEGRRVLLENGLLLERDGWNVHPTESKPDWVDIGFKVSHPASGEYERHLINFPIIVGNGRPADKGLAAALTTATSYFITGLLLIPRGDEEIDKRDDTGYQPQPQRRSAPPPPSTPSSNQTPEKDQTISERKVAILRGMTKDEAALCAHFKVERVEDLTNSQFVTALSLMEKRKNENADDQVPNE